MKEIIEKKLIQQFAPTFLEVVNNSHLHNNHFTPEDPSHLNQTHFLIKISAPQIANQSKITTHRVINNLLKEQFANGLHALEIKIL